MRKELLDRLKKITPEEEQYLGGRDQVRKQYSTDHHGTITYESFRLCRKYK